MPRRKSLKVRVKPVYSTGEVAEILCLTTSTVVRAIDRGALPGFRVPLGKARRVTREQLLDFIGRYPEFAFALEVIGGSATEKGGA